MIQIIKFSDWTLVLLFCLTGGLVQAFDGPGGRKGFGPISEVKLDAIQDSLAVKGYGIFTTKCAPCHKMQEKIVGPPLGDVTRRRTPEWIMNMVLNPAEMIQKDPDAKELFETLLVPMTDQQLNEGDARAILDYLRYYSEKGKDPVVVMDSAKKADKKNKKSK